MNTELIYLYVYKQGLSDLTSDKCVDDVKPKAFPFLICLCFKGFLKETQRKERERKDGEKYTLCLIWSGNVKIK